jgi:UDP-N-acetylglucosamine acyltransferase
MALSATWEGIHPTALIGSDVHLAPDVQIGPFAIIEGAVEIGPGCVIEAHACLRGPMTLGAGNYIGHGAILGTMPQSRTYRGEETSLRIGNNNVLREYVTVHRGTVEGGGETVIGDRNYLMNNCHIGHDSRVGNGCTLVNGSLVAGHVELHDGCILSGHAVVQQRCRIGRLALLGGLGATSKDIPPFVLQEGFNCVSGLNLVGLRRAGIARENIDALKQSYRVLYKEGRTLPDALGRIEADWGSIPEVRELLEFIRGSRVGVNPARDLPRKDRISS